MWVRTGIQPIGTPGRGEGSQTRLQQRCLLLQGARPWLLRASGTHAFLMSLGALRLVTELDEALEQY